MATGYNTSWHRPGEVFQAGRVGRSFSSCPLLSEEARHRAGRSGRRIKGRLPPLASTSSWKGPSSPGPTHRLHPACPWQLCSSRRAPSPSHLGRSRAWPHRQHLHGFCGGTSVLRAPGKAQSIPRKPCQNVPPELNGCRGKASSWGLGVPSGLVGMDSPLLTKA